jgi:hypothetical protein
MKVLREYQAKSIDTNEVNLYHQSLSFLSFGRCPVGGYLRDLPYYVLMLLFFNRESHRAVGDSLGLLHKVKIFYYQFAHLRTARLIRSQAAIATAHARGPWGLRALDSILRRCVFDAQYLRNAINKAVNDDVVRQCHQFTRSSNVTNSSNHRHFVQ